MPEAALLDPAPGLKYLKAMKIVSPAQLSFERSKGWLPIWARYLTLNHGRILSLLNAQMAADLGNFPVEAHQKPALVVGSGPSAEKLDRDWVRQAHTNNRFTIVTGPSTAPWLNNHGLRPDMIVAVDSQRATAGQLSYWVKDPDPPVLVTHPAIHPEVLLSWPGKVGLFLMKDESAPALDLLQEVYRGRLNYYLVSSGCVFNSAVATATALAYWPIFLVGCDFGYVNGRTRVGSDEPPRVWEGLIRYDEDRSILTTGTWLLYKAFLLVNWYADESPLWNLSDGIVKRDIPTGQLKWIESGCPPVYSWPIRRFARRALNELGIDIYQDGGQIRTRELETGDGNVSQSGRSGR